MSPTQLTPTQDAFAGALGAVISLIAVYPLDISKTNLQVQSDKKANTYTTLKRIYLQEGILGLYTGITSAIIQTFSGNFSYFFWYRFIRSRFLQTGKSISTFNELAIGAVAGALCQITTIPISVVVTRQQTTTKSERKSLTGTWNEILGESGWQGLYKGFKASLVLTVNPSITYGAFQKLKTAILARKPALTPFDILIMGALSKSLATVVTYPYIMAKTRLQWKPSSASLVNPKYKSAWDVLVKIVKSDGFSGLYHGLSAQIGKAVLQQALLFVLKDKIERVAHKMMK